MKTRNVPRTSSGGLLICAALVGLTVLVGGCTRKQAASESTAAEGPQTTCPIMGGKINKDLFADHDGKRVYVCCSGCLEPLKKDAAAHIKKLEQAGVTLAKAAPPAAPAGEGHAAHGDDEHGDH